MDKVLFEIGDIFEYQDRQYRIIYVSEEVVTLYKLSRGSHEAPVLIFGTALVEELLETQEG